MNIKNCEQNCDRVSKSVKSCHICSLRLKGVFVSYETWDSVYIYNIYSVSATYFSSLSFNPKVKIKLQTLYNIAFYKCNIICLILYHNSRASIWRYYEDKLKSPPSYSYLAQRLGFFLMLALLRRISFLTTIYGLYFSQQYLKSWRPCLIKDALEPQALYNML